MLSVRCPVCLSVCDVRALWPNGWTDQDETWHAGLGPGHIVLDGDPAPPPQRGTAPPNFRPISVAAKRLHGSRINLSLSMELGLGPGDFMLDGDPAPPTQKRQSPRPNFRHMFIVAKRLDATRCHLARR